MSQSLTLSLHQNLTESSVDDATAWVTSRLSAEKTRDFSLQLDPIMHTPKLWFWWSHMLFASYSFMSLRFPISGLISGITYHISILKKCAPAVCLSEGSGRKQTNNQHKMTTVVSGGLPLRFWYQTSSRCIVHAFG